MPFARMRSTNAATNPFEHENEPEHEDDWPVPGVPGIPAIKAFLRKGVVNLRRMN